MAKWLDNYNDSKVTLPKGFVGMGNNTKGRDYSPAWGGQFQSGGFLQPTSSKLPEGYVIPYNTPSTELAMSIGGEEGEPAYLIPSFKGGKKLKDPIAEYKKTGEHLGGPFKTWQEAEKFGEMRHKYVEKGQDIPTPLKTWGDMAMGGSIPGAVGFTYARTQDPAPSNGPYAKKTLASAQDGKDVQKQRYNQLYAPIENKVFDAIETSDNYDRLPYSTKDFLNKTIAGFSVASNRNIPPMDPIIKEVQEKVKKLPKEELKELLNTNWSKIGVAGAMKNTPSSVSYLDMLKYVNHFNKLKKKGYTLQNGGEMKYYQEGLDWKPKSISKNGKVIKDDRGQWAHPGEITEIGSNDITMQGVDYPVLGISDTGDTKMMQPGEDYKFDGEKVTEYPMAQNGDWLSKYTTEPMRQDATRVTPPVLKLTDKEKLENAAKSDQAQKKALNTAKEVIAERKKNKATKGDLNTPGSWHTEDKGRLFPNSVGGAGEIFDDYLNPAKFVGVLSDALGESVAARDPKAIATSLALAAGTGALGLDPLGSTLKVPGKVAQSMESGLLSNAWRLNPKAYQYNIPNDAMFRGLGKEGMEDAVASGVFRAKQNVQPEMIGNLDLSKRFNKAYFSPKFNIADDYGQGFIAEVPKDAGRWTNRYSKGKDWSQIALDDVPTDKGKILQKDWLKGYKEVPKKEELVDLYRIQEKEGKPFAQLAKEGKIPKVFNNPETVARKTAEEKHYGQWFTNDKADLDWYARDREFINPETIQLQVPKSKLSQYQNYDKSLSRAPEREFVVPLKAQKRYNKKEDGGWLNKYK